VAKAEEELKACELCGATIYPEHLKKGTAAALLGRLLCPHCLVERRQIAAVNPAAVFAEDGPVERAGPLTIAMGDEADQLFEATDDPPAAAPRTTADSGGRAGPAVRPLDGKRQRPLEPSSPHATRCRTFQCKLNGPSLAHLNEMINEWVDAHDDVVIKFATNCIGMVEGKSSSDPNLFVTVFY
jgi:hypothetical protein